MKFKSKKRILAVICILAIISLFPIYAMATTTDGQVSADEQTVASEQTSMSLSLIHSYNFENDTDKTVLDCITGNGVNGTKTGTSKIVGFNDKGSALHFDGNSYVAFSDKVIPAGKKTISFKIRKGSTDEIPAKAQEFFFGNLNGVYQDGTFGFFENDGKLSISCDKQGKYVFATTPTSICDNKWHDILFTWDGTTNKDAVKLYVDDMSNPVTTSTCTFTDTTASTNLYLGTLSASTGYIKFIGDIDDFQVYSTVYLSAPSSLTATASSEKKQIDLTWNTVTDSTSYNIYRSETQGADYVKIGTSETNTYSDQDTNLTNDKTYYYVVTAVNSDMESTYSNEASATITINTNNNALLTITYTNGLTRKYDIKMNQFNDFLNWYNSAVKGSGNNYFTFDKSPSSSNYNQRQEYVIFDKISNFDVEEY